MPELYHKQCGPSFRVSVQKIKENGHKYENTRGKRTKWAGKIWREKHAHSHIISSVGLKLL